MTVMELGKIRTLQDVIQTLEEADLKIGRMGKSYLTVHDSESATSSVPSEVSMQNSAFLLAEKLRARTEKEGKEKETPLQENVHALLQHLQASSKNALTTTEHAVLKCLMQMEQNISFRCRTTGTVFSRLYRLALLWSCSILIVSALTIWGLLMPSQYRIKVLEQEISYLSARQRTRLSGQQTRMEEQGRQIQTLRREVLQLREGQQTLMRHLP